MAHIKAYFPTIRPYNNKKDSKIDPSLRRRRIIHENSHGRNKRFQLPVFPTANQRYGQNLAVTSTNVREFVSGPILAVAVMENVWEPLKLGLISG